MIALAGTIGAGKTSLTGLLADHLNSQAFYESVDDNKILPLFYKDPKKYGFLLQIYFLNRRLDEIKDSFGNDLNVLDRSIFEDALLFKLNADMGRATETESDIYSSLLHNMMEELPEQPHQKAPNLLITIQVSFETMLERIKNVVGHTNSSLMTHLSIITTRTLMNATVIGINNIMLVLKC